MAEYGFELPEGYQYVPTQYREREVNPRKAKCIPNRTNYFCPDTTRTHVRFSSQESYRARQQKIEGYENRIYWEYRWCNDNSGTTYFYTLTYNENAMPKYLGENCFDYEDLRYLLNGGFKKKLLRNYGTNFKYFVGAELGDGKGSRGMANNPHYHVLFFTYPDETYTKFSPISPKDFRNLVKTYWQGFDETRDGYHDYRDAKFGIAKEGDNEGVVTDFRACMYCAKYVCKDVSLRKREKRIREYVREQYINLGDDDATKEAFWNDVLQPRLNPKNADGEYEMTNSEVFAEYAYLSSIWTDATTPAEMVTEMCLECADVKQWYIEYVNSLVKEQERLTINEYRNRYCNKCRVSQGLGDYALQFIDDVLNPRIKVPSKKGYKGRPIGMYYYRKLFCNVVKDDNNQNVYVLNQKGIEYKLAHLPEQLEKLSSLTECNVKVLTRELYDKMVKSNVNTDVNFSYDTYMEMLNNNKEKIFDKYAEFKLIYEDRFFKCIDNNEDYCFPTLNPLSDYERFITPVVGEVPYSSVRCRNFVEAPDYGYLSYLAHPYFIHCGCVFRVFDLLDDYLFCENDAISQRTAEEIARIARFHKKEKLNEFYANFSK